MTPERRISEAELHAYVDGELATEDRAEVEALLAANPAEALLVRGRRDFNEAMARRYASPLAAPVPERMQQVLARMPVHGGAEHSSSTRRWMAVAAAALIAAMAGAAGYVVRDLTPAARRPETAFIASA